MDHRQNLHESYSREDDTARGSERSFGIVFAVVFAIVGCWPLFGGNPPRIWSLAIAGVFVVLAFLLPVTLKPLNRLWFRIGTGLHHVVSPLMLGLLFYFSVLPTGLLMRAFGKDPLRLRLDRKARSYWIERKPPGPAPDSLRNQF
ncbi:MAG: SxtJ family membrane protein [Burkholderiales bacterium]